MIHRALSVPVLALGLFACDRAATPTPHDATPPTPISRCPEEMGLAGNVCVDKYEAAIDGVRFSHALGDAGTPRAIAAKGVPPQVNVSEVDAEAACAGAQKRLCTEAEWLAACEGPQHHTYPYGNEYVAGACNDARPSPVKSTSAPLDDPKLAEAPNGSAPGGSFTKCVSDYGMFDMHGNVHEWTSGTASGGHGVFRGGFFADAKENGAGCTYRTVAHDKTYHDYSTGFRCCKDPR